MPAEQMATQAFTEQTRIGWQSFFYGYLSSSWRQMILFCSPTRDAEVTEKHLCRLLKKLHSFSLSLWNFRNGVLHGDTYTSRKEVWRALIRAKVQDAYWLYDSGKILLLSRDTMLFTKYPLETRLLRDDDALLCWLRSVEVAMQVYEKRQTQATKNAAVFFQPFRDLGRQTMLANRVDNSTLENEDSLSQEKGGVDSRGPKVRYSWREEEQLTQEMTAATQQRYNLWKGGKLVVQGLNDTILSKVYDSYDSLQDTSTQRTNDS